MTPETPCLIDRIAGKAFVTSYGSACGLRTGPLEDLNPQRFGKKLRRGGETIEDRRLADSSFLKLVNLSSLSVNLMLF